MRISFDLDDTLVGPQAPRESRRPPWFLRWRYPEELRAGTCDLMDALAARGCEVWVYTTSFRSPRYIRCWFRSVGIPIRGVVNQDRHDREIGRAGPSKHPGAFGIDLHVDDSEGVAREGLRHGFDVIVVSPADPDWSRRILAEVDPRLARARIAEGPRPDTPA